MSIDIYQLTTNETVKKWRKESHQDGVNQGVKYVLDQMKKDGLVAVPLKATALMVEAGSNLPATEDWEQFIYDAYSAMLDEYINPKNEKDISNVR